MEIAFPAACWQSHELVGTIRSSGDWPVQSTDFDALRLNHQLNPELGFWTLNKCFILQFVELCASSLNLLGQNSENYQKFCGQFLRKLHEWTKEDIFMVIWGLRNRLVICCCSSVISASGLLEILEKVRIFSES